MKISRSEMLQMRAEAQKTINLYNDLNVVKENITVSGLLNLYNDNPILKTLLFVFVYSQQKNLSGELLRVIENDAVFKEIIKQSVEEFM